MSDRLASGIPEPNGSRMDDIGSGIGPNTGPALALRGVRIERGGRVILDGIDLTVPRGSITAVLGPSGAGKSTLLHTITGELRPSAGTVEVFGEPVRYGQTTDLLRLRRSIGVLLQGNGLLSDLTAGDNIALPLRAHTRLPDPVIQRVVELKLNSVGLRSAIDLFPRELSGGMMRRVALARSLALDPPLMLYDEPLTGLDPIASAVIVTLIQQINRTLGVTSLVITHHMRECLPICDRAIIVANRGIVFNDSPDRLAAASDPLVRQFVDGAPDGPIPFDPGRARPASEQAA